MRNLRIGLMAVLCVLWAGAVWADKDDKDDKDDFAPVPQTGQVISYDANTPKRDDGALQKGVELPTPRFTDKGNGTIKDNLTGLIWLKNANCPGIYRNWQTALDDVASLNTSGKMNSNDCGDTSGKKGTHRTDWRLPNVRELFSLVDFAFANPAISNAAGTGQGSASDPFSNLKARYYYWSSTTNAFARASMASAWFVNFGDGYVGNFDKTLPYPYVIAVRGGSEDR